MAKSVLCLVVVVSILSTATAFSFSPVLDIGHTGVGISLQACRAHKDTQRTVCRPFLTLRRQWNQEALLCSSQSQIADVSLKEDSSSRSSGSQPQSNVRTVELAEGRVHTPPKIEIRRATLDELTIAYRHRIQQPNLLGQIGMLCSTVLYGTEHLQEAVMKDFERRYGKDRRNAGFLILAIQPPPCASSAEADPDAPELELIATETASFPTSDTEEGGEVEIGPSASRYARPSEEDMRHWPPQPKVIGCVGVEVHPLLPNGGRPPVLRRDANEPTWTAWERVRHRPLLSNLAVDPSFRRQRIGSRLVQACEEEAIGMGFDELLLKVEYNNEIAVDLYASLGYEGCPGGQMWEDKFVASGSGGEWQKTVNVALRKSLPKPQPAPTDQDP